MSAPQARARWRRWLLLVLVLALAFLALALACVSFGPPSTARAFAGRSPPLERSFPLADGRVLSGAERGNPEGPLVLLVHGSPGAWRDWSFVLADERLAQAARLVAVDRLGWGASAGGGLAPALGAQAAALQEVLAAYPANLPALVVGHSLGGPVAARLALDASERVRALVLVAASIDPELEEPTWYQTLGRTWLVRPLVPDVLARADDEIRPLRGELEALLPRWSALHLPVFVLQGEEDALVPAANADFAARAITHAPLSIRRVPDVGHLIPWERPELIVDLLLHVLAEH